MARRYLLVFGFFYRIRSGEAHGLADGEGEGDALGFFGHAHLLVDGVQDGVPELLFHHHHQNFLFRMEGDAEECRGILPGHAAGMDDGAAANAQLPGHVHHILGKAGVDDGEDHFMVVVRHILFPPKTVVAHKLIEIDADDAGHRHGEGDALAVFDGGEFVLQGVHDLLHRVEAVEFASEDDFADATESDNAHEHVLLIDHGKHVGALVGDDAHELTEVHVGRKGGGVFDNHFVERHEREHGTVLVVREKLPTARETHGIDAMRFEGMNH